MASSVFPGPTCYPWWHVTFAPLLATPVTISSGCKLVNSNVNCAPETMRANAEAQMQAKGYTDPVTLDAYSLARNIQTEVGSVRVEEMVALAESTMNQAKRRGTTVSNVILGATNPANTGYYGQIQDNSSGRWTASSADPTVLAILVAQFVLAGKSANFTGGAVDQDGLEYRKYFPNPTSTMQSYAQQGLYWVGPLPGVNPWKLFLWRPADAANPAAALLQRGLAFVATATASDSKWGDPNSAAWLSPALPICPVPPTTTEVATSKRLAIGAAALGGLLLVGGATWLAIRQGTKTAALGKRTKRLGARAPEAGSRGDISDDEWEVAEDALLEVEGKTGRARDKQLHQVAKILAEIRRTHGYTAPTKPYERAFHKLPIDDQFKIHEWSSE